VPPGLQLLKEDLGTAPDPMSLWGDIDAVSPTRHQWVSSGGPDGGAFRRMTAKDGDLYHGDSERAELGNSNYQLNSDGSLKTFYLYQEGQRRVTSYWMRLPTDFPIDDMEHWQVVMQMKQSEPATNADGTPVISLQAIEGNWILKQSTSSGVANSTRYVWTTPARVGVWTHIVVDATYSSDPAKGLFQITIGGVTSPVFHTYNLKKEVSPAGPGLRVGDSIPSHLRLGIYHDTVMPGTSVDIADVQVFG
jgi:Polysaccharide lyase